jgi:hypothetical protein
VLPYVILGVSLLVGLLLLARWFADADPRAMARFLRWLAIILGAGVVAVLAVTGRLGPALTILFVLVPLAMRWRAMWNRAKAERGPSPGGVSRVETAWLEVELDHDSGTVSGEVRRGAFAGRALGSLDRAELTRLHDELNGADAQSASIIAAYLDRTHPDWREPAAEGKEAGSRAPARAAGMTTAEAYEVLGLAPGATAQQIKEAHHRLMKRFHPDQGGSDYFAAKLNEARDLLLRS